MTVESTIAHDAASLAAHINANGPARTYTELDQADREFYSTYWVAALAYAFNKTHSSDVLAALHEQWAYVQTLLGTAELDSGFWRNPLYSTTYYGGGTAIDHHGRYLMDTYASYRLLSAVGETTLATEMLAAADAGVTALMNVYPAGGTTITGNGSNQPLRADTTAYAYGDVVRLPGGEVLWCSGAGTSGSSAPAAPGSGNTVTDGTVEWTQERTSFRVFPAIVTTVRQSEGSMSSPNQALWWTVAAAALYGDPASTWYQSQALMEAVDEHVEASILFQLHRPDDTSSPSADGLLPHSASTLTTVSSVYHSATAVTLAILYSMLGPSWKPRVTAVLAGARDLIADNFEVKPNTAYTSTAGWHFSSAEADVWSGIIYHVLGGSYPHTYKMFTNEHHDAQGDYSPVGEYGGVTTDVVISDQSERGYCNLAHEAAFVVYTTDLDVLLAATYDLDVLLSEAPTWPRRRFALLDPFTPTRL